MEMIYVHFCGWWTQGETKVVRIPDLAIFLKSLSVLKDNNNIADACVSYLCASINCQQRIKSRPGLASLV